MKSISDALCDVITEPKEESLMSKSGSIIIFARNSLKPEKMMRLSLSARQIDCLGDFTVLHQIEHIVELDLSRNEIHSWNDVGIILGKLKKLKFLDLSFNPLSSALDSQNISQIPSHSQLSELALNSTQIPIYTLVDTVLDKLPNIAKLWLCLNEYDNLMKDVGTCSSFPSLRQLHLGGNKISDSGDLNKFCSLFPGLNYLSIRENSISDLEGLKTFSLEGINLCDTFIKDWSILTHLNSFPLLSEFQLLRIPFIDKIPGKNRRDLCISYLPNLRVLNKTPVTEKEREKAERAFIRLYMNSDDKTERFYELSRIHGKLDPLLELDLSPPKRVTLRLHCEGFPNKSIPVKVKNSVLDLRKLICRELFDNKRNVKFKMFHDNNIGGPDEMKYPQKLLYSLRVCDGDTIVIVTL